MALDTTVQVYDREASGWQRGLYDDVKSTFRAPIVNWIFRTTMANEPAFLRYAWGQVAPIFETRAFAEFSVDYRDRVLSELDCPTLDCAALDTRPAEYRELRGQLATYDVVAPRLAALFETLDRTLQGERLDGVAGDAASTAPYPAWLDRDRGLEPTMIGADETPAELTGTLDEIRAESGFDGGLPSIYRTLAQWPSALRQGWRAVNADADALSRARRRANERTASFVDELAYTPRTTPADLEAVGLGGAVDDLQALFGGFNEGAKTTLPMLPAYAAIVGASGRRQL